LALLAFFVLAASAQAHTEAATTACTATGNTITFTWTDFYNGTNNGGFNTPGWKVVYTPTVGTPVTLSGNVSFPGDPDGTPYS